ncbi:MAG: HEAT repeat domain-containing protein [Leptolyngbyaceae cyanobacterium]
MVEKLDQPFKKSRNYGTTPEDLQDRLDLVAALLDLADDKIAIPPDKPLKAQFKLEWVKEDQLQVSGTVEAQQEKGTTKKDLGVLLEVYRHTTISESARNELIQNALVCLWDLKVLQKLPSNKNQGFWKFSLCLKHQTAEREQNLQVIKDQWQAVFGKLPQPKDLPVSAGRLQQFILGLRGDYREAQGRLEEITEALRQCLQDQTLAIAGVEAGSVLLVIESSQTGYEQLKRLIGQEIAGFPVEYAIDQWQRVCRRMLIDRKPLTSNTVLGRACGDRNLIDEDLFVDLALVQPKRGREEQHPEDIDPEQGSVLFTRQEVEQRFAYQEFLEAVIGKGAEQRMAIVGEPGAGKTTLLRKLAFWLLQTTDDLVIYVDLADWGDRRGNQGLGEYLENDWLKEALGQSWQEMKGDWARRFEAGAVWLLLDGFDEMSQRDQQGLAFRGWVTNARLMVTCRLNVWQANPSNLQGFQTYLTQPFEDEQVETFIRRWFPGVFEPEEADLLATSLWAELQGAGKERIKDLCRNPLRLTLLCATWQVDGALPDTMADLYAGFVAAMYRWKEDRFEVSEEERERLNAGLGALALASLDGDSGRFRLSQRLVCEHLGKPQAKGSLLPLALQLGWLNQVGVAAENRRETVYGFYHATFQEYFAALAVDDWDYFLPRDHVDRPVAGKRYRIFEPQWKQVILLWLGRGNIADEEKESFIRALFELEDGVRDFYEYQAYFLAAAGINEFKACSLSDEIVSQVVKWGLGCSFLPIEKEARSNIPKTNRKLAVSELIRLLEDPQYEYDRIKVAETLGKFDPGNPEAIDVLISLITQPSEDKSMWMKAIRSLGEIGQSNPKAIDTLVHQIEGTEDEYLLWWAAKSLAKITIDKSKAISVLVSILVNTHDSQMLYKAATSLAIVGNLIGIEVLVELLTTHNLGQGARDQVVRTLLILGEIEDNAKAIVKYLKGIELDYNFFYKSILIRDLIKELSKHIFVKPRVLYETDPIFGTLVELIETHEDKCVRQSAIDCLEKIGKENQAVISFLIEVIQKTTDRDIGSYIRGLETIGQGNPKAIAALVNLLGTTSDSLTCRQAVKSLKKILAMPEQYAGVVAALKGNLSDEVYQNDFQLFHESYELIWNCAENLPYPQFYRAWHHPPTTPHPEIAETTPIGSTPLTQHHNLALLPQLLTQAIQTHQPPLTHQLICIDVSRFSNPSKPFLQLYNAMKKAGCPAVDDKPSTIEALQDYCEATLSKDKIALFLYEDPNFPPQGFDVTVLNQLARFNLPVAVVVEDQIEGCALEQFLETDPNLVGAIVQWLQNLER